jgi:hypothetical protein
MAIKISTVSKTRRLRSQHQMQVLEFGMMRGHCRMGSNVAAVRWYIRQAKLFPEVMVALYWGVVG